MSLRIGQGWDLHRLVPGRELWLGGLSIPSGLGEDGHSDGDVLLHAITDALLGAAALGDIGGHFPPSDPSWKGASSKIFVQRALALLGEAGYRIANLDATIVLEKPKLAQHIGAMRVSVAHILGLSLSQVSIKAKTSEGQNAVGRGEAIEAMAVVLVEG
ncbi:MAG TPA: 2-C-methyl-D-erythritol 2,4-cyclodiphosphate synthase [Spirochaetaceae bacterium]|jgi:2-C-methyl-D-erythritol 2,4-cyclodiphosphate synthase|nr:2-C-methyl-D-erythritol 2,4-cyclodiphosphate synthase [Spirochaetaceae bacterium]